MDSLLKRCTKCRKFVSYSNFSKKRECKDGFQPVCKTCVKIYDSNRTGVNSPLIKMRVRAIEKLGGQCVKCGYLDVRALQIDHINGGGGKDRRDWSSPYRFYRSIAEGENLEKYQVLCANCNVIKRSELQEHGNYYEERRFQSVAQA